MRTIDKPNPEARPRRRKKWPALVIVGFIIPIAWVGWYCSRESEIPEGWEVDTISQYDGPFSQQLSPLFSDTNTAMLFGEDKIRVMSKEEVRWLGSQRLLANLFLINCDIRGLDLSPLHELKELISLGITEVQIAPDQLTQLLQLPKLEAVGITSLSINDTALAPLISNPNLKSLSLTSVALSPQTIEALGTMKQLKVLLLENIAIDDAEFMPITQLTQLTSLSLSGTKIGDAEMARVAALSNLTSISLNGTLITGEGLKFFSQHPAITYIHLDAGFAESYPQEIDDFTTQNPQIYIQYVR